MMISYLRSSRIAIADRMCNRRACIKPNRDLEIVVYGKCLTSDTLLAIKTKSLTVKYITYRIYLKYRKLRIETPCLTTETWRLILNDFVLK